MIEERREKLRAKSCRCEREGCDRKLEWAAEMNSKWRNGTVQMSGRSAPAWGPHSEDEKLLIGAACRRRDGKKYNGEKEKLTCAAIPRPSRARHATGTSARVSTRSGSGDRRGRAERDGGAAAAQLRSALLSSAPGCAREENCERLRREWAEREAEEHEQREKRNKKKKRI